MKSWRPITRPRPTRVRRALAATAVAALAMTSTALLTASPASAVGTLNAVSLTVSNNAANVGTVADLNTATYTWAFTTASDTAANTLSSITFTVPDNTVLASPVVTPYGLPGCTEGSTDTGVTTGSAALSGTTVTLTFDSTTATGKSLCGAIPANTPAVVQITGFTNPTAATVTAFKTTVTTQSAPATTIDNGTDATGVNFADNTTTVNVFVPESLTFTNDADHSSISLAPVPAGPVFTAPAVTLTVKTNMIDGYELAGCIDSGLKNGTVELPQAGASVTGPPAYTAAVVSGTSGFGAEATVDQGSGAHGTLATAGVFTSSSYTGYSTDCSTTTTLIAKDDGPASNDSIAITNAASASATQASGTYTGTITYVVTPKY